MLCAAPGGLGLWEAPALHGMRRSATGGLLFIDFRAAPSGLHHRWIERMLTRMSAPALLRRLLDSFHQGTLPTLAVGEAPSTYAPAPVRAVLRLERSSPSSHFRWES